MKYFVVEYFGGVEISRSAPWSIRREAENTLPVRYEREWVGSPRHKFLVVEEA